ncbi:MAG: hypothetical protein ACTSVU_04100 [Promethearchaeota archaeon]
MFYNFSKNLFSRNEDTSEKIAQTDSIFYFIFSVYNLIFIIIAAIYEIKNSWLYLLAIPVGVGLTAWTYYRVFYQKIYYTSDILYINWVMIGMGGLALIALSEFWSIFWLLIFAFFDAAFILRRFYDSLPMARQNE